MPCNRRWPPGLLVALLLAGGFATAAAAEAEPASVEDPNAEYYDVKLVGIMTSYGQERWKLYPSYYAADPPRGLTHAGGKYDGAVGYRVSLRVQLVDETGKDIPATDPDLPYVNLTAEIMTGRGPLKAYVSRDQGSGLPVPVLPPPAGSNSAFFWITFDMDGTNLPAPNAESIPPLFPGVKYVHVDIVKRGTLPGETIPAGETDLSFDYAVANVAVDVGTSGGVEYLAEAPDDSFRLLNDVGHDRAVPLFHRGIDPGETVNVSFDFGVPNAPVRIWAMAAEIVCQPPSCTPAAGARTATTEVHRKLLAENVTNAAGAIRHTVVARNLIQFPSKNFDAALVVVAAQLAPEVQLGTPLPAEYAMGSAAIRTGAREVVLPITSAAVRVAGYDLLIQSRNQTNQIPNEAVANFARSINALEVMVYDDAGQVGSCGPNCGDAVAVQLVERLPALLAKGPINPSDQPSFARQYRIGRIPVENILEQHVTKYRVLAFLYEPTDEFYGMTFADRGYDLSMEAPPAITGNPGTVWLNFSSVTTNYDQRPDEPLFRLPILHRISIVDLRENTTEEIVLPEAGLQNRAYPVRAIRAGDVAVTYLGTTGDALSNPMKVIVSFTDPPPKKGLADRIPGFEAAFVLLASAGAVALGLRRRGRGEQGF